ncbi:MAG: hypothetical protein ABFD75_13855 [Smithella sp.]
MNNKITGRIIIGGIFFLANSLLIGCESADDVTLGRPGAYSDEGGNVMAQRQNGVMTMIEEVSSGDFRIVKEYPSKVTGVVVKKLDGTQETIPEEKIPSIMDQSKNEKSMGVGSVLTAGLVGYMMGRNSSMSPYVYKDDSLYQQSLMNRQLLYKQQEEDDKRRGYTGYWSGGRYYSNYHGRYNDQFGRASTGSAKSGFFSRLGSSFRSLG